MDRGERKPRVKGRLFRVRSFAVASGRLRSLVIKSVRRLMRSSGARKRTILAPLDATDATQKLGGCVRRKLCRSESGMTKSFILMASGMSGTGKSGVVASR